MTQEELRDYDQVETRILKALDQWWEHSAWFPEVKRDSVNLSDENTDAEIQDCILRLIADGSIEVGIFPEEANEVIILRDANSLLGKAESERFLRATERVVAHVKARERRRFIEIRNTA